MRRRDRISIIDIIEKRLETERAHDEKAKDVNNNDNNKDVVQIVIKAANSERAEKDMGGKGKERDGLRMGLPHSSSRRTLLSPSRRASSASRPSRSSSEEGGAGLGGKIVNEAETKKDKLDGDNRIQGRIEQKQEQGLGGGGAEEAGEKEGRQQQPPSPPLPQILEHLSHRGKIIYLCTQGDQYFALAHERVEKEKKSQEETHQAVLLANTVGVTGKVVDTDAHRMNATTEGFKRRTFASYQEAFELAKIHLDPFDPMRLLTVHSLCKYHTILATETNSRKIATELASQSFYEANHHHYTNNHPLTDTILQRLRDDYMVAGMEEEEEEKEGEDSSGDVSDMEGEEKEEERANAAEDVNGFDPTLTTQISVFALRFVERIKKEVSIGQFIPGEELMSAADCFRAMDSIFRAYVRGNALPGQQESGSAVTLGGNLISMSSFLLRGPYISWKGFLCVLRDFNIASAPSRRTKLGKLFPKELWGSGSLPGMISAPLTMQEAACVFIECSITAYPTLCLRKNVSAYAEARLALPSGHIADTYRPAAEWVDQEDWGINCGLNFAQFCDCMAKCGSLAYSMPAFKEALPTTKERIEHFFSAHMGLTDREKWHKKIERKEKQAAKMIQRLKSSASAPFLPPLKEGQGGSS